MFSNFDLTRLVIIAIPLLVAVTLHEVAHGYVAYRLGDPTAKMAGRLTLNPIKHLDIIGSFLLPFGLYLSGSPFLFGYAKPVPVNFARLPRFNRGMRLVASAGIVTNLGLAVLSAGVLRTVLYTQATWVDTALAAPVVGLANMAIFSVQINTVLAIFNLIPVPPLDGSKILFTVLPAPLKAPYMRVERYGMIIIFLLLITNSLGRFISFVITPLIDLLLGK
jgi:Zn-dependent protease